MKIAFYKGLGSGYASDIAICLATFSKYSHCELVFSDGMAASATRRDGGVRFKRIIFKSARWDIYDLPMADSQEIATRAFFNLNEGSPYDTIGAVLANLGFDTLDRLGFFCSSICSLVLGTQSYKSPDALHQELVKENRIVK